MQKMRGKGGKLRESHALETSTEKGDKMRIAYIDTIEIIAKSMTKGTKDNPDLSPEEKILVIAMIELFRRAALKNSVDAQELANSDSREGSKMNEKLQKEYIEKMNQFLESDDPESAHYNADRLLCELLEKIGYTELVKRYKSVPKWYS
jgi:hypothetical protein